MRGYPNFSFGIPITLAKIYFFLIVITFAEIHLYQEAPSLVKPREDSPLFSFVETQQFIVEYNLTQDPVPFHCCSLGNKEEKGKNKNKKGSPWSRTR